MRQGVVRIDGWSWAFVCVGLAATAPPAPAAADPLPSPSARFALRLTSSMTLPLEVRDGAVHQVQQIWAEEGVAIDVAGPLDAPGATSGMRVLIVFATGASARGDDHRWPVAELTGDGRGQAMAIASLEGARRVLVAAGLAEGPDALVHRRLGVVLGRAIAHEVGHHLLNTPGHARHGLMRARIDARDFADLRDGGFGLDDDAAQWARARLTRPPADALRLARFVYRP